MTGRSDRATADAAYAASHPGRFCGRSLLHGPRAEPECAAGAPDHASPAGTVPKTADPGATSASPHVRPGREGAAGTDAGVGTDPHGADVEVSPVEPVPGEVDLGLDRAARPQGEQTGHGRDAVEVDVGPTRHPRSLA